MRVRRTSVFWIVLALLIIGGFGVSLYAKTLPGKYDALAQCLAEKGVKFYGAFWCERSAEQKRRFGNSAELLPYVECWEADGKTKKPLCLEKKIVERLTWEFPDGTRLIGEQWPKTLADKAGCEMPD